MTNGTEEGDRWEIGLGITKEKTSVALLEAVTDCPELKDQTVNSSTVRREKILHVMLK